MAIVAFLDEENYRKQFKYFRNAMIFN